MQEIVKVVIEKVSIEGQYQCHHCKNMTRSMTLRGWDQSQPMQLKCPKCGVILLCQFNFGVLREVGVKPG